MPLLSKYGDLNKDDNYFQLVIDLIGLQNATMVKWLNIALDPVKIFEALCHQPRSIHAITWEMLFQAGEQHQARVVMDKSLDSVFYAKEILKIQPHLRFLNVVRDPRAQICSMNRSIIYDFDTLLNTQRWLRAYQAAKTLAEQYPQRVLTIRFEDFIHDQEKVLRKICAFFEIDFLPIMLDITRSDEAQKISHLSALWQTNVYPPIQANIDKFKQHLSLEEIELIERLTGELMDLYGYEKLTSVRKIVTNKDIQLAHNNSEINRKQAWLQLAQKDMYDYHLRCFRHKYLTDLEKNK
jgi:hypothetical protein